MHQGVILPVETLLPHFEGCKEVLAHRVPLAQFGNTVEQGKTNDNLKVLRDLITLHLIIRTER